VDQKYCINTLLKEIYMATYRIVLRDAENPATSDLHVYEVLITADNRQQAQAICEEQYGVKHIVAGPLKVED
jgi:hypothetical protein